MWRGAAIPIALLALSAAVQTWMIARAVVPAQDAVRYVLLAQAYERDGVLNVVRNEAEHPLYPLLILLAHESWEAVTGRSTNWALCAQVTAAAMLVLSVVPVYGLLARLVDRGAAAAGGVFYCLMTSIARQGADALSDSTQLLLYATAVYCIARYWHTRPIESTAETGVAEPSTARRAAWLFAAGISIGLALLARPEAAVVPPALIATLLGLQCVARYRQRWASVVTAVAALGCGLMLIHSPYLAATRALAGDSAIGRLLGRDQQITHSEAPPAGRPTSWRLPDGRSMEFGIKDRSVSTRFRGYASAAREYLRELPDALHYWIGLLAVAGVWLMRGQTWRPFDCFALVLFAAHSLGAIHMAAGLGYLSARHLTPLAVVILAPAGYAAVQWGTHLRLHTPQARAAGMALTAVAALACLPRTLAPLHASRLGHRLAGQWLAAQSNFPGAVLDTRGWTGLYSGRTTLRYDAAKVAYRLPELAFVVIEQRELELGSPRAQTLAHLLRGAGEEVARFVVSPHRSQDNVLVFRWHPERFTERLRTGGM